MNALELLEKHDIKQASELLGTSPTSLRLALYRKGISVFQYRRHFKRPRRVQGERAAFVQPSEMRPFVAMAAMEADTGGCRWPYGDLDKDNFRYCGRDLASKSWCAYHQKKVYAGPNFSLDFSDELHTIEGRSGGHPIEAYLSNKP